MKHLERFIDKFLGPIALYMSNSKFFSALTEAFMRTTPITLGASVIMIIGNFPVPSWVAWLQKIGIYQEFVAAQGATLDALAIFVAFNFAYCFVKKTEYNPLAAGLLSVASFLMLMPQSYVLYNVQGTAAQYPAEMTVNSMASLSAFSQTYTGGGGLIVAIIVGYLAAQLYIFLNKKNLVIKLPDTVPTNVAESLSPSILFGAIFLIFFAIRLIFKYAPILSSFGNIFQFISGVIQIPLQDVVGTPVSLLLILTLANVFWYFGIHPQVVYSVVTPIVLANSLANISAYTSGQAMPYFLFGVVGTACSTGFGGQGGTIGLVISMIQAKSKRYKEMFKLTAVPSIFNINEPLIFGMPIMMNPIFFIPMLIGPVAMGLTGWGLQKLLNFTSYNPTLSLPWTTPAILKMALQGGWKYFVIGLGVMIISTIIWYPFFKMADSAELENEGVEAEKLKTEGIEIQAEQAAI